MAKENKTVALYSKMRQPPSTIGKVSSAAYSIIFVVSKRSF